MLCVNAPTKRAGGVGNKRKEKKKNEHIYKTETDSQRLWLPRASVLREGRIGSLGLADAN